MELFGNFEQHIHNGTDSKQIDFKDLLGVIDAKITYNPGSLIDGAGETADFTVKGARLGDFVLISAPYNLQGIIATGYVKASDTISIRLQNETGGTIDLASGSWRARVIKLM